MTAEKQRINLFCDWSDISIITSTLSVLLLSALLNSLIVIDLIVIKTAFKYLFLQTKNKVCNLSIFEYFLFSIPIGRSGD